MPVFGLSFLGPTAFARNPIAAEHRAEAFQEGPVVQRPAGALVAAEAPGQVFVVLAGQVFAPGAYPPGRAPSASRSRTARRARPLTRAAAIENGQSSARSTSPARGGLRSTYRESGDAILVVGLAWR